MNSNVPPEGVVDMLLDKDLNARPILDILMDMYAKAQAPRVLRQMTPQAAQRVSQMPQQQEENPIVAQLKEQRMGGGLDW